MTFGYEERYGAAEIGRRVQDVAKRISSDYPSGDLVLIAVLKGAAFFLADLARAISRPLRLEYIDVIRGPEEEIVDFHFVAKFPIAGKDVVILKDVIRSGIIEGYLMDQLREEKPASIRFACLVDRPQERKVSLLVDYVLFPGEEGHLVGYGMEYRGLAGNLPYIAQIKAEGENPFNPPTGWIKRPEAPKP